MQEGAALAASAVALDRAGDRRGAIDAYKKAIDKLLRAVEAESDANRRTGIVARVRTYLDRCEELSQSQSPSPAGGVSSANPFVDEDPPVAAGSAQSVSSANPFVDADPPVAAGASIPATITIEQARSALVRAFQPFTDASAAGSAAEVPGLQQDGSHGMLRLQLRVEAPPSAAVATSGASSEPSMLVSGNGVPHYAPERASWNGGGGVGHTWESIGASRNGTPGPNPNGIGEQYHSFTIPLRPRVHGATGFEAFKHAESHTHTPMGPIGVMVNGVPFFNVFSGRGGDAVVEETFDAANGHPDGHLKYHYHQFSPMTLPAPSRGRGIDRPTTGADLMDALERQDRSAVRIVGYAFDGFPMYGPLGINPTTGQVKIMRSSYVCSDPTAGAQNPGGFPEPKDYVFDASAGDLDECNGMFGPTPDFPQVCVADGGGREGGRRCHGE